MAKIQSVIQAFENLDSFMLVLLLDNTISYQDVSKSTFIRKIETIFSKILNDGTLSKDFKAVEVSCDNFDKKRIAYSFVNSQKKSFGSFIFETMNNEISNIYYNSNSKCDRKKIKEICDPIVFYDDEKINTILNQIEMLEKEKCLRGLQLFNDQLLISKKIPRSFLLKWYNTFEGDYFARNVFENRKFLFRKNIYSILFDVKVFLDMSKKNKLAIDFLELAKNKSYQDPYFKCQFLITVLIDFKLINLKYNYSINKTDSVIHFKYFDADLKYVKNYIKLYNLFQKDIDFLPYSIRYSTPSQFKDKNYELR